MLQMRDSEWEKQYSLAVVKLASRAMKSTLGCLFYMIQLLTDEFTATQAAGAIVL
jgi:hypothetical protein